ncbi:Anucleate primary sterigmata protein A [Lasiodiplodia hormozganensis]|uniref:Anucleate primary sterigmata protein A n=1 Tax=Lasiodiplodia hormozganensis TaxID=869390 RepID=A0AA39YK46_9PEZI|nr:Anucleate primary sterigmata protein A [Lasiodiplodia hormozganensis]
MPTTAASPPKVVAVDVDDTDPFVSPAASNTSDSRRRYAGFDNQLFSIYAEGSPSAAKRALEAHLAETERRLQEASQLGTILVQQRKELSDRLKDIAQQQDATEIGPDLRAKLVELEREFNEVGKDTARAFIPKTRVPSYHQSLDADGNSIFSSEAQNSPSKISVPSSRKQRNQQPNRIHDIKLATEISSSLLNQVRELQAALAEKDEQLKMISNERSRLEVEVEGLTQRLRVLDESEQRFKDENWSLETRIQELTAQQKEAADKEHRLNQNLTTVNSEKSSVERELEDLKQAHGKLHDDYQAAHRQHEAEIMGLRRNVTTGEAERSALQRKIEDLLSQNEELARAVAYHRRLEESGSGRNSNEEGDGHDSDQSTPDHSPPPSPSKFTPRHSQLETETLKSSLQHAHRMIQNLKNNIHREKTEKMELRRLLQEAKDELDIARREAASGVGASVKKRRPNEKQDLFKKPPRPDRLGMARGSRDEIIVDDGDWEDNDEHDVPETPSRRPKPTIGGVGLSPFSRRVTSASFNSSNNGFQTATESSDAFETANEPDTATETEAFQTGVETMAGSSTEEDTETEMGSTRGPLRSRRYSHLSQTHDNSYLSTASTSGDEIEIDSEVDIRTPQRTEQPRYRLKVPRGARRSARYSSEALNGNTSDVTKSPSASFMSDGSQAEPDGGKSLLAELGSFSERDSDMDPESEPGTPGRHSIISPQDSPEQLRKTIADRVLIRKASLARAPMVDSSTNTEPWSPSHRTVSSTTAALGAAIAGGLGFGLGKEQDASTTSHRESTPELAPSALEEPSLDSPASTAPSTGTVLAQTDAASVPANLGLSEVNSQQVEPLEPQSQPVAPPNLQVSSISSLTSEPVEPAAPEAPKLAFSSLASLHSEPVEPAAPPAPKLALSSVASLHSEPIEPEAPVVPALAISSVSSLHSEEPIEPEAPVAPKLGLSSVSALHSEEPIEPEAPVAPKLGLSSVSALHSEPIEPEKPAAPKLGLSSVSALHSEPVELETPSPRKAAPAPLNFTPISSLHSEPVESEPPATAVRAPAELSQFSSILSLQSEPVEAEFPAAREVELPASNSQLSQISSIDTEPVLPEVPEVIPPSFQFSSISSLHSEPVEPVKPEIKPIDLNLSSISSLHSEPVEPVKPEIKPIDLKLSSISSLHSEPIAPAEPEIKPADLHFSSISSLHSEPVAAEAPAPPKAIPSTLSPVFGQSVEPVSLPLPEIFTKPAPAPVEPVVTEEEQTIPSLSYANISAQDVEPVAPEETQKAIPSLSYANISTQHVEPEEATMPGRLLAAERKAPGFDEVYENVMSKETHVVATQEPVERSRSIKKVSMAGTQTVVSSAQLDELLASKERGIAVGAPAAISPSKASFSSSKKDAPAYKTVRRPTSSQSMRSARSEPAPPLPADHRELIAAATQKTPGAMGPPTRPASAMKNQNSSHSSQFRPRTPNGSAHGSVRATSPHSVNGTTPRPRLQAARSEVSSPISRRTSVSSFASEVDNRFNISANPVARDEYGQAIDPRLVAAITQTMIGEFMWKYTRKAGREEMSVNRHRRFFWVHPYTRTLYWSDRDPATAGKTQLKAKSVQIEDVRVETDDNPYPPGLHRKSLIVITPGRAVKFTATTGQRHETWFNALSYLLLRTNSANEDEPAPHEKEMTPNSDEASEFNPGLARRNSRQTAHSRMSLSSYNSRGTRNSSPQRSRLASIAKRRAAEQRSATLTPTTPGSASGRFSSLSGLFRPQTANFRGSFSSRRSKISGQDASIYDASLANDSAEDLRRTLEAQEAEADRLENVRACCDGKHDVGSLSKKPHHHHHQRKPSHTRSSSFGTSMFLGSQSELDSRSRNSTSH